LRFNFTKKRIDALTVPASKRVYYYDTEQRGLLLTVYPSGQKTFSLYRKIAGRPERITIGPYPDLTIEQARKEVQRLAGEIAQGQNPAERQRAIRGEMTFEELFAVYLEKHAKVHKRTWKQDADEFRLYLNGLRRCKISSITRPQLVAVHAEIGERGEPTANRTLKLLSKVFNWARQQRGWTGENPATGIKLFKEKKRQRFLDADELPNFFRALAEEQNATIRDYILAGLLTGARRSNLLSMAWNEIRWGRAVWEIPAEKSKSGEAMDVMLTPPMLDLLERRRHDTKADPVWVFPGSGKSGHLVEPKTAWARILKRAGITDCRLHDLRRTLGSWQALQGASLGIIGASLGHQSLQATQVYARLNADPVRASVARAIDAMQIPRGLLRAKQ
jgi:integrase